MSRFSGTDRLARRGEADRLVAEIREQSIRQDRVTPRRPIDIDYELREALIQVGQALTYQLPDGVVSKLRGIGARLVRLEIARAEQGRPAQPEVVT